MLTVSIFLVLSIILATAVWIVFLKNLFALVIVCSLYSLACALFYILVGAADVALTESSVGVGISTILALLTIAITNEKPPQDDNFFLYPDKHLSKYLLLIICLISIIVIGFALHSLPTFGHLDNPTINSTYWQYVTTSYNKYHVPNMVTMILGSFRGFDTMGELLVIFLAAISVYSIIGTNNKD